MTETRHLELDHSQDGMSCPQCDAAAILPILWGDPGSPPGGGVILGGCTVPADRSTHGCPECGWRGWRERIEDATITCVDDLLVAEGLEDFDGLIDRVSEDTDDVVSVRDLGEGGYESSAGVELLAGTQGVGLPFPFRRAEFWGYVAYLEDASALRVESD